MSSTEETEALPHIDCYDCYVILQNIMLSVINVLLCEPNGVPRCISVCASTFSLQCSCQYELNVAIQCIYRRVVLTLLRYFIIYYYNLYHYEINMCYMKKLNVQLFLVATMYCQ